MRNIAVVDTSYSVENGGKHDQIDNTFKNEFVEQIRNFADLQQSYFADPVEEEGLCKGEEQENGLELAEEDGLHDVGQDEDVVLFDDELRGVVELVYVLHFIFLYF